MRQDVTFRSKGQNCVGWLYTPDGARTGDRYPGIVMAQGFSCIKEMQGYMQPPAERFAAAGFAVLVFDYRCLGDSDGDPRNEIIPGEQQEDIRSAITWISQHAEVDPTRIGIWGTSYGGGHVFPIAAFDRRVKAAVSQVPLVNGWRNAQRLMREDQFVAFLEQLAEDRRRRYHGDRTTYYTVVAPEGEPCVLTTPPSHEWFINAAQTAPRWQNKVTMASLEAFVQYLPEAAIDLVSPTPLLMIIADQDILAPTDLAIRAYRRALQPKSLSIVKGGHFAPYDEPGRDKAISAAVEWFNTYL